MDVRQDGLSQPHPAAAEIMDEPGDFRLHAGVRRARKIELLDRTTQGSREHRDFFRFEHSRRIGYRVAHVTLRSER